MTVDLDLEGGKHGLTTLTRAAKYRPERRRHIEHVLTGRLDKWAEVAIEVAQETGDPIGKVLADCVRSAQEPDAVRAGRARHLMSLLPVHDRTVALLELGALVTRQALEDALKTSDAWLELGAWVTQQGGKNSLEPDNGVALLRHKLSCWQARLGHNEAALEEAKEAVTLYRKLVARQPGKFEPRLAAALGQLGIEFGAVGQRAAALQVTEEAVTLYRTLAAARPETFTPALASALDELGNNFGAVGERGAALQVTEDAVTLFRDLAEKQPEAFTSNLATNLLSLGAKLDAVGQRTAAVQKTEEAVTLYRKLAITQPGVFEPRILPFALGTLALQLIVVGRWAAALKVTAEAIWLGRSSLWRLVCARWGNGQRRGVVSEAGGRG